MHRNRLPDRTSSITVGRRKGFWKRLKAIICCGCISRPPRLHRTEAIDHIVIFERDVQTEDNGVRVTLQQHRPHTPGNRKRSPEVLAAVQSAISELQTEKIGLEPSSAEPNKIQHSEHSY